MMKLKFIEPPAPRKARASDPKVQARERFEHSLELQASALEAAIKGETFYEHRQRRSGEVTKVKVKPAFYEVDGTFVFELRHGRRPVPLSGDLYVLEGGKTLASLKPIIKEVQRMVASGDYDDQIYEAVKRKKS